MSVGAQIIVHGIVQGVGFRYFVRHRAQFLNLGGFVKNLFDGTVEIEVSGDRSLIEEFIKEVNVGPRSSRVTGVTVTWKRDECKFDNFEIR